MGPVVGTDVGALTIGLIDNGLIIGPDFRQRLIAQGGTIIPAAALGQKRT